MKLFVTGFGPFDGFDVNPSERLAELAGLPHQILPVSYAEVDSFFESGVLDAFDALLMLGVASGPKMRVEHVARNFIGTHPDCDDTVAGPGPIDPRISGSLAGTLWPAGIELVDPILEPSVDAGDYLCNYCYFRALQYFPSLKSGFLHVAPESQASLTAQQQIIAKVIDEVITLGQE